METKYKLDDKVFFWKNDVDHHLESSEPTYKITANGIILEGVISGIYRDTGTGNILYTIVTDKFYAHKSEEELFSSPEEKRFCFIKL